MSRALDIMYMTKHLETGKEHGDRPVLEIEITEEMVDAGIDVLIEMTGSETSNADRAIAVFAAMAAVFQAQVQF